MIRRVLSSGFAVASGALALGSILLLIKVLAGETATWVIGRAAGVSSYVLLVGLVMTGLVLSHPWAASLTRPSPRVRIALHMHLATYTAAFVVVHLVVLALDPWAEVGVAGALVPMASTYRPVPVSLGVIAWWAGVITALTARFAGRLAPRAWWPIHKVAAGSLVLTWAHSITAGTDVVTLRPFYLATGGAVVALALTRYLARTPDDLRSELTDSLVSAPVGGRR